MSVWWAAAGAAVGIVVGAAVVGLILRNARSSPLSPVSEQWLAHHKHDRT